MEPNMIYLDNNATTPLHPAVKAAMIESFDLFGNASSFHEIGRSARAKIEECRNNIASFIGAASDELIFVGSGSEANNTILNIFSLSCKHQSASACSCARGSVITSTIEHPCIMETSRCLMQRGLGVNYVKVDAKGYVDLEHLKSLITNETGLVSIMMANNEIGTIQKIKEIAALAHERGVLVHTDAVQALGKIDVNVQDLGVDFLSLSGHKIYGPKGIGVLYTRKGTPFCPLITGGHQEYGKRAGTENTLGIIGMSKAIDCLRDEMTDTIARTGKLKKMLKAGLETSIPDIHFNGDTENGLSGTLNVSFDGAEGEAILLYMDLDGIAASTGSACSSGSLDPSHVLMAVGTPIERAHGSIRFSFGRENSEADVQYVLDTLPAILKKIRAMSTAYKPKK